jgi:hypothetical protein
MRMAGLHLPSLLEPPFTPSWVLVRLLQTLLCQPSSTIRTSTCSPGLDSYATPELAPLSYHSYGTCRLTFIASLSVPVKSFQSQGSDVVAIAMAHGAAYALCVAATVNVRCVRLVNSSFVAIHVGAVSLMFQYIQESLHIVAAVFMCCLS